jgi:hypothetical protein
MISPALLRAGFAVITIASITNCAAPGSSAPGPTTTDGADEDAYLTQSIVDPGAHIVETFTGPKMPDTYGEILREEQISALVAYLKETT